MATSKKGYQKMTAAWDAYVQVIRLGGLDQLIELAHFYKDIRGGFDPESVDIVVPDQEKGTIRLYKFGQAIGFRHTGRHVHSLINMALELDQSGFVSKNSKIARGKRDWFKIRLLVDVEIRRSGDLAAALKIYKDWAIGNRLPEGP